MKRGFAVIFGSKQVILGQKTSFQVFSQVKKRHFESFSAIFVAFVQNHPVLAHLSSDTSHDSQQLYREILHAYQWNTKLRENSHWAFSCAQQNSTKRWSGASNHISGRRRPFRQLGTPGNHTFKSQDIYEHMKKLVTHLSTIFAGLCDAKLHSVNQIIPVDKSNSRILEVTVQNTMRVFLVLRGYLVETIVVRGLDESRYSAF